MLIAVIGTRKPSAFQEEKAEQITEIALDNGYNISTGAAEGIDSIAMKTCQKKNATDKLFVYLPWEKYNRDIIPEGAHISVYSGQTEWTRSVNLYHPNSSYLSRGVRKLHARNYGIIVKADLVAAFPNQKNIGGTGQGMRIAKGLNIPCFVIIKDEEEFDKAIESIKNRKEH